MGEGAGVDVRGLWERVKVGREVMFWEEVYRKTEEYKKKGYRIRHGGLTKLLEEERSR